MQIPHADDYCNRVLFGVVHCLPDQERTEGVPYRGDVLYPTGVSVQCDACREWLALPDEVSSEMGSVQSAAQRLRRE